MIGQSIGKYSITRFIGEGGMGSVWEGIHPTLARRVAIKVLHPHLARNPAIRDRFKREGHLLESLKHPNIIALYDIVETQETIGLVMEYVEGIDLEQYVRQKTGPIPENYLIPLFHQKLQGMAFAHLNKIIHRDIKPSNIMITPNGTVKILDFGIGKMLDSNAQLTKTGMRLGTVLYMSPEQVNSQKVDFRSDIYALGVTLFFMATGTQPYEGTDSEFVIYQKITQEPLPNPMDIYPGVPFWLVEIISKATAKDPAKRFLSCEQFLGEILTTSIRKRVPINESPYFHEPIPPERMNTRFKNWSDLASLLSIAFIIGFLSAEEPFGVIVFAIVLIGAYMVRRRKLTGRQVVRVSMVGVIFHILYILFGEVTFTLGSITEPPGSLLHFLLISISGFLVWRSFSVFKHPPIYNSYATLPENLP